MKPSPHWQWTLHPKNKNGTKINKSIQIHGQFRRFFFWKERICFSTILRTLYFRLITSKTCSGLFIIWIVCPGVKNPLLLQVESATYGIKKATYWHSKQCLLIAGKRRCEKCSILRKALNNKLVEWIDWHNNKHSLSSWNVNRLRF